jgi:hypothetical protein
MAARRHTPGRGGARPRPSRSPRRAPLLRRTTSVLWTTPWCPGASTRRSHRGSRNPSRRRRVGDKRWRRKLQIEADGNERRREAVRLRPISPLGIDGGG